MGDPKKSFICNNEQHRLSPAQALLMANPVGNLLTPLVTDKEDTVTDNPFENPLNGSVNFKFNKITDLFFKSFRRRKKQRRFLLLI